MEPPYSPRKPSPGMRKAGYIAAVLLASLVLAWSLHHWWLFVVTPPLFWVARAILNRRRYGPAKTRAAEPRAKLRRPRSGRLPVLCSWLLLTILFQANLAALLNHLGGRPGNPHLGLFPFVGILVAIFQLVASKLSKNGTVAAPQPADEPVAEESPEEVGETGPSRPGPRSPASHRMLDLLLWPIGRWGPWKVGLAFIILLTALSWATHGFGFEHSGSGGRHSASVLMDGKVPVQHTDRSHAMTQEQVLALAGLPKSIRFYPATDASLSQLPPGMASWTIPGAFGHDGNREVIWKNAPIGIFALDRFEPWGTFQLLVVNTGHGLKAVYFPSSCATREPLGVGPPPHGPTEPIILLNPVTNTCS